MPSLIALLLVSLLARQGAGASRPPDSPTVPNLPDVNPEVLQLVIADQWDRGMDMFSGRQARSANELDWAAIAPRDRERAAKVRDIVARGKLTSGRDFQFAALVLQHSERPDDVGLAHVLAATAALKGQPSAKWLAAAAFDRLLWDHDRPQIFGTQFKRTDGNAGAWTMEPYNRDALSDSVRAAWCVVSSSEQAAALAAMQRGESAGSTSVPDCK